MKKIFALLTFLILVGIFIPTVSADETIDLIDSGREEFFKTGISGPTTYAQMGWLRTIEIEKFANLEFIYFKGITNTPQIALNNPSYAKSVDIILHGTGENIGNATAYYNAIYSSPTTISEVQFWLEDININVGSLTGTKTIILTPKDGSTIFNGMTAPFSNVNQLNADFPMTLTGVANGYIPTGTNIVRNGYYWKNQIIIGDEKIKIVREIDGNFYPSNFIVDTDIDFTDNGNLDNEFWYAGDGTWNVTSAYGKIFTGDIISNPVISEFDKVTIYVRNSQTGAAIANSRCIIDALVDGDYYPVVNRTEPSGIFSVTLQPTGGGMPNPDGYRLIASAEGYNNPMPEINFTVDEYTTSMYFYLDPIGGAPENENNTFIDFFVRDMSANPISGATVNFGGYTLITNSAGYTIFEVAKNKTYSWTVSKSGYGSLTGNAVIGSNGRHTINTVLAPAVTPTIPTAIPTSTPISPTPTMTAPTGEPVSNWLEWFAAHFGMILGGGVEIGKIFMWLCFSVPVGVYVGKEAKAGAAGFMAGAGIVTLFFVLIGWVPIWLLVLLALIIGLLYAKVFNNSDNGGGR
jgi:hypothetical protein